MENYIKKQEKLINDFYEKLDSKTVNYIQIKSALNALDITNEMQEYYLSTISDVHLIGERIIRFYGLLQGLFVGIDSLYSLNYATFGSKSFININQNKVLKELKYIRNDVVGHPSNRQYNNNEIAYCYIDMKDVDDKSLAYQIISKSKTETRHVDLIECLRNYYIESIQILSYILELKYKVNVQKDNLISSILKEVKNLSLNGHCDILNIKTEYIKRYGDLEISSSRFLWRVRLIEKAHSYQTSNSRRNDYINYAVSNQLIYLLNIAYGMIGENVKLNIKRKLPHYLSSYFKFLKANKQYLPYNNIFKDINHPYFSEYVDKILEKSYREDWRNVYTLFNWILELKNDGEMVFLITSCFNNIII